MVLICFNMVLIGFGARRAQKHLLRLFGGHLWSPKGPKTPSTIVWVPYFGAREAPKQLPRLLGGVIWGPKGSQHPLQQYQVSVVFGLRSGRVGGYGGAFVSYQSYQISVIFLPRPGWGRAGRLPFSSSEVRRESGILAQAGPGRRLWRGPNAQQALLGAFPHRDLILIGFNIILICF